MFRREITAKRAEKPERGDGGLIKRGEDVEAFRHGLSVSLSE